MPTTPHIKHFQQYEPIKQPYPTRSAMHNICACNGLSIGIISKPVMNTKILKNSKGQYFTVTPTGCHTATSNIGMARLLNADKAGHIAEAFNRDHDDDMSTVDYATELLAYTGRELA